MAWLRLRVHTRSPEFAEELLTAHGAAAVSFVDAEDSPILEPGVGETPLWPNTVTEGWFAEGADVTPAIVALRDVLTDEPGLTIESHLVEDRDWVREWLANWPPLRFTGRTGRSLWVCPRERRAEVPDDGAPVLLLDPGLAFGTGSHATTALCLEWLTEQDLAGKAVLDYGCGSGILAIAALLLGAERAVGVDNDPQALIASRDNAAVNGVSERLTVCLPEDFVARPHGVLLANILANPLISLAPRFSECLEPEAPFALAGLLERHAGEVRAAYAPWAALDEDVVREGWTRVAGRCHEPALINARRLSPTLLTAGQPQRAHFAQLAAQGIEAVINLAMPAASPGFLPDEAVLCAAAGMTYAHIPVAFESPQEADYAAFAATLAALPEGTSVLVHCALNYRVSGFLYRWRRERKGAAFDEAAARADVLALWRPDATWARFIGWADTAG